MKKLLTFLFALMLIGTFSFGNGNYFVWTNVVGDGNWQNPGNWTVPTLLPYVPLLEAGGTSTWPGQNETGDWAVFDADGIYFVNNIPSIKLGRLEINKGSSGTFVIAQGVSDGVTITMRSASQDLINNNTYWVVKIEDNCLLDLNFFQKRIKMVCEPGAHFWQQNNATFNYADYYNGTCNTNDKGFVLQAVYPPTTVGNFDHAEFIQQENTIASVKGWAEYVFDDGKYHFICPPVTSEFTAEFSVPNDLCRKANSLCVFDGDYVRKFSNGVGWDNWLGTYNCFDPMVDIQTGRGYEYYGNALANPTGKYSFYGTFNSGNPITLPVNSAGWNFIGNPYASTITFGEPSGAQTAGAGWTWNRLFTNPNAYWWDQNCFGPNLPGYRHYNWLNGVGNYYIVAERRNVPRSQGFYVYVSDFSIPANAVVMVGNNARIFRGYEVIGKSTIVNNMNITLNDVSGKTIDGAIINFRDDAIGFEFDRFLDAYKIFNDLTNVSQVYFKTTDNIDLAMKTLKLETGNIMYPLYLKVVSTGTYSLDAKEITFAANTGISLKDNKTNTTVDLKVNPVYTFTATAGDDDARFSLYFSDVLGVNKLDDNSFKVYSYDNSIYIQNNNLKISTGTVLVYDMIGKEMMQEKLSNDAITRMNTNLNTGFYIVSVKTDKGVYNQKVFIN